MLDANSLRQTLSRGRPLKFNVSTTEMMPELSPQDMVSVYRTSFSGIKAGDVVLCKIDERVVLRKVIRKKREHFGTAVIEVTATESVLPTLIPDVCVLGKVTAIRRAGDTQFRGVSFWDALSLNLGSLLKRRERA